jgi:serine protease Do
MMGALDEMTETVRSVISAAAPSVVRVGRNLRGCGVVVGHGLVATSAHNLRGAETTLTFADGRQTTATLAGADFDGDLAVLRADTGETRALERSERTLNPGDPVLAVGGGASTEPRVTIGWVTGVDQAFRGPGGRRVTGAVEHTAPLPRGSSGGAIVDTNGALLGINTHRLGDGFYLAVPADKDLGDRIDALARGEEPHRRRLGVGLAPPTEARRLRRAVGLPERDGLLVRAVAGDSPASAAGLRAGDLLVAAGDRQLRSADDLFAALDDAGDAGTLRLTVVRGADELEVVVTFAGVEGRADQEGSA